MTDRSKFYKKPLKFGVQTIYDSDVLAEIANKHWETFDEMARPEQGFKIGDFIDNAVNLTAIQLVAFLDEFSKMNSIDEVNDKIKQYIEEIQKEVKL
jgi:hypothetical protein